MSVVSELAETYPQLYLDPDKNDIDAYRPIVLRGDRPERKDLSHFVLDPRDKTEFADTPAGTARVVTLYDRSDFEVFNRCMMAAKEGPEKQIPASMGAATLIAFNWPRINAHREEFLRKQREAGVQSPDWPEEFRRFTQVKENYMDMLIVLSRGPYSNVSAETAGQMLGRELSEAEWLDMSDTIRKYHELTHFTCRKLYPEKISAVWDELVADAAGIYAALGRYDRRLEELFLGIEDGRYAGGRLENYTYEGTDLDDLSHEISGILEEFEKAAEQREYEDVFGFMLELESRDIPDCLKKEQ